MAKHKKNTEQNVNGSQSMEKVKMQPTIYTFDFKDVPAEKYTDAMKVLFHDPNFAEAVEKRNFLVKSAERMRPNSQEMLSLIKAIRQRDHKLADMLFASLVQINLHSEQVYDFLSFSTLLKYYVDYSKEGMKEKVNRLAANLDKITFLADMLESLLVDVKEDMRNIFGETIEFNQFDAVVNVLTQLRGFFKSTRCDDAESAEAQLYINYADSINDYLAKRLKTFSEKYHKLRPVIPVYTEEDMIDALNQFVGTDKKFNANLLRRTVSGGFYIDAVALAFNLNQEQTRKVDELVGPIDANDTLKYSLKVTDMIMSQYKKK